MSLRRCRHLLAASLISLLAACGGGGGGADVAPVLQSPPPSAASLTQSEAEAALAVQASVGAGAAIAEQDSGPDSGQLPFGNPFAAQPDAHAWLGMTARSTREQRQAVTTFACAEMYGEPCSGSVSVDSNFIDDGSSTIAAGAYVSFAFDALQASYAGEAFTISGTLRVDYLSAFDPDAATFANARFRLTSGNLSGAVDGVPFGPKNAVALVEFDGQGAITLTTEGRSFSRLAAVTVTDAGNYSIGAATVRRAHWSNDSRHVETTFLAWNVSNGRPTAGSVTVVGAGGSVAIAVTTSSSTTVVYGVVITIGTVVKRYTVTATHPVDGGVATYTAVELAV